MRHETMMCAVIALSMGACGDNGGTSADTAQAQDTAAGAADTDTAEATLDASAETRPETVDEVSGPETVDEVSTETTPDTAAATVTWDDVYPIFAASCAPCHNSATPNGGPSGGHSIASSNQAVAYQASQLPARIAKCAGKKIGECALIRIQDGSMPASGDCREPKTDKCPDASEQALIQQWIDDGMLEN